MSQYIICYDISCAKRLRKAAKILQGVAIRVQKSVYLLVGSEREQKKCWQQLACIVSDSEDLLTCYCVPAHSPLQMFGANVLQEGLFWSGLVEPIKANNMA